MWLPALPIVVAATLVATGPARVVTVPPLSVTEAGLHAVEPPAIAAASNTQDQAESPKDGIAAIVNGEVISMGQVARAEALLRRRDLDGLLGCGTASRALEQTEPARAEPGQARESTELALACLIDATLVFREVRRVSQLRVREDEVEDTYKQLGAEFDSEALLEEDLRVHGLTPETVRRELERQLMVARYIDRRFRATIDVSDTAAQRHYDEVLVPGMVAQGIEPPPFEQVAAEYVRPILRERELNRRVQSWIADLHARATIVRRRP